MHVFIVIERCFTRGTREKKTIKGSTIGFENM